MSTDAWVARTAAAACCAARWPLAFSLALSVVAAAAVLFQGLVRGDAIVVLGLGLVQAYSAVRIELDRAIFERFADDPASAPGFDAALVQMGWARSVAAERPMADRARGVDRFVKCAYGVLVLQLIIIVLGWLVR